MPMIIIKIIQKNNNANDAMYNVQELHKFL